MITFQCIECDMDLEIDDSAYLGQKIRCIYCGAEFEVVALDPIEVDWADDEDEEDLFDDPAAGVDHLDEEELVDRVVQKELDGEPDDDNLDDDLAEDDLSHGLPAALVDANLDDDDLDDDELDDDLDDDELDDWDLDDDDLDDLEDDKLEDEDDDEWEWDLDDEEDRWS